MTARVYCTELSTKAWPDSDDSDENMDTLTDGYIAAMRDKAFTQCMSDEGFPPSE
ncbi:MULTISPECIES: hypothetical protein [unclassified Streptomyces]|uniref:hypothetical protein n=1 Tax=unclassified Streptomyces TaxID=2593676 RepID=UPI002DD98F95|nr:hypothetical protein [Streptomyces sp. NBC_01750]WSB05120.1 hypothetical protein OIE54_41535 [Streptomyces sp. NBC_01794]WSD30548.1 hypothetical protein OG966_00245 [Streptomyces sp. NBC_01750]